MGGWVDGWVGVVVRLGGWVGRWVNGVWVRNLWAGEWWLVEGRMGLGVGEKKKYVRQS